jgi:cyanophycinase
VSHTNYASAGASDPLSIHNMRLHILSHGDRFDLHKRQIAAAGR